MKNRYLVLILFILSDCISSVLSLTTSLIITNTEIFNVRYFFSVIALPLIVVVVFYLFKIYNILWRYATINDLLHVIAGSIVSMAILFVTQMAVFGLSYNVSIFLICSLILNGLVLIFRMYYRKLQNKLLTFKKNDNETTEIDGNVMIIGAGSAGQMLINELTHRGEFSKSKIKCVIDDDTFKKGKYISGIKIVGGREVILDAAKKYEIDWIVFAIPNCKSEDKSEILNICQKTDCKLRVVPSVCKMYNITELSSTIRKVEIEDLLGREPVNIDLGDMMNYVYNKVVLVTGGGGSIGSELCRQIAHHNPKLLIIFDIYENTAYEIQNELRNNYPNINLITLIGSVRDSRRLDYLFKKYKPEIVYHAAAHKHVPLMEDSPNESIKNNIFGTLKTVQCADKYGVNKFILISSDKAVNPTNIMGATKRVCEMIIQTYNSHSKTDFMAVRFGNVLGSNGSVVPIFKNQIKLGGPVTVTDPNVYRYFMTIPEAVSLVLRAGVYAKGGEIFVLNMGEPVRILTLAENLIRLSGFTPYKDINIEFTGLRPGEKLFEELFISEEGLISTENNLIFVGKPISIDEKLLLNTLEEMKNSMYDENTDLRTLVRKIVPTYVYESKK